MKPAKCESRASAGLTHTVLTLDVWTQSVPPDTDAGSRLPESGARVSPEIAPMSSGFVDSAGEAATTTCVALRAETPSVGPRCASAPLILAISELTISGYPAYMCPYPTLQVRGCPPPSHGLGSGRKNGSRILFLRPVRQDLPGRCSGPC